MQVAITGATGFVGSSILKSLDDKFVFVPISSKSLNDANLVESKLNGVPTLVHMAGISSVSECEKDLNETYRVNVALSCFLAEVFFRLNNGGHFIFLSSSLVYDQMASSPQSESSVLAPKNAYSRSKLVAEAALSELARIHSGQLTILRLYNYTHKTQSTRFVLPSILHQIENSNSDLVHLNVGNIDINRDFSAIQDFIDAFRLLLNHGPLNSEINIFNLCSGVEKNLRQLIVELAQQYGKKIEFGVDQKLVRPNEIPSVFGSSEKFQSAFGWSPLSKSNSKFLELFLKD